MNPAVSALKKLALLEPDLIMPATIERAIPSLQGLEEASWVFCSKSQMQN
jgi:proteasome activator subunit 4